MIELSLPRDTTQSILTGATTFRTGHRKLFSNKRDTPFNNFGGNRANIEKPMRQLWNADKGMLLCQVDQAGAEALIVSYLCKDKKYRSLFKHGIKPHIYLALKLFKEQWREYWNPEEIELASITTIPLLNQLPFWKALNNLIKSSDNWLSSQRYYHFAKKTIHCVDKDTEVLTPNGWIKVSDYKDEEIMVYNVNQTMHFEAPIKWNQFDVDQELIYFSGPDINQYVTSNHRMLYYANDEYQLNNAEYLYHYKGARIPTCGNFIGGDINLLDDEIRLIAAIQADGSIQGEHTVIFHFAKARKVKRLEQLLNNLKIKFKKESYYEKTYDHPDRVKYIIRNIKHLIDYLDNKKFNYNLLKLTERNLRVLLDELENWDGSVGLTKTNQETKITYLSEELQNIDFVKTLNHILGFRSNYNQEKNGCYRCSIKSNRTLAKLSEKNKPKKINYNGKVYCPTVSTGFFLIRRNGKISITGNSGSYGMFPQRFRLDLLKESAGRINLSFKEAERFLNAFHLEFPEIREWHQRVFIEAKRTNVLRNLFDFPYNITDYIDAKDCRDLIAWVPQSTVACITKQAIVKLYKFIKETKVNWHLLMSDCHDSYLAEAQGELIDIGQIDKEGCIIHEVKGDILNLGIKMKEFIEIELVSTFDKSRFQMKSEASIGHNWASQKKDNQLGLRGI